MQQTSMPWKAARGKAFAVKIVAFRTVSYCFRLTTQGAIMRFRDEVSCEYSQSRGVSRAGLATTSEDNDKMLMSFFH